MDYPLPVLLAPHICLLLIAASLHEAFFPIAAASMLAASYASPGTKPHAIMHSWIKKRYKAICSRPVRYYFARTQAHPLLELPQELVDMIYQHLDVKDAACLSLCNKNLYWRLDTTRHQDLRIGTGDQVQRKDFLARLARDNPKVFLCRDCSYLHLVAKVGPPLSPPFGLENRLTCNNGLLNPRDELPYCCFRLYDSYSNYRLAYNHIQLAMARNHRRQGHGISIDKLSLTEVHRAWRSKFWVLFDAEPEVINH
ncbi:hypothetical protein M409DRAFT_51344 [Zasmidium cellare ATCC 36951]|uniref:F-box domain-containing protein n=1 Tax=Zasmidium cellare ATCC 36951 TaxID=1080233 RepID=A0A6A6CY60_ZASCE|nr:uncharacterized protein M409DRAFT_51344 [Zasmidium cellare ATCC 36951]KAF2171130.1 hypothetical protein M409DRAFT_51344 [Zasmidium cellare ATCC 36951]